MRETTEVAIIGGGAAGCSVAYYLATAGVSSIIVEREGVGSQASGYSAGGLNPLQGAGIPGPLGPLAIESFRMHFQIWDDLSSLSGVDFHSQVISNVRLALDESGLEELEETARIFEATDGFSAHWLDPEDLAELEPGATRDYLGALYAYGNATLDSYLYTIALSKAAEKLRSRIRTGSAVGVMSANGRATGVVLEEGEIRCDSVVLATGPWSRDAEEWLGVPIPIEPLKGEILRMRLPEQEALGHELSGGPVSLFLRADGLVWVGATEERRGFDKEPSESAQKTLLDGAVRLMPAMAQASLVKHTACLRPVTPDWLPIIGGAPGWENVYLATGAGKKGILISPGIGKAVADLIVEGRTSLPIAPFAPDRFAKG